jgi:integrase/recombinase XerD
MLDGGADVRHIQALVGHASLASTERYTHVAIARLHEVHARTDPAARAPEPPPTAPPEAEG